jgi:hypothetical protein
MECPPGPAETSHGILASQTRELVLGSCQPVLSCRQKLWGDIWMLPDAIFNLLSGNCLQVSLFHSAQALGVMALQVIGIYFRRLDRSFARSDPD